MANINNTLIIPSGISLNVARQIITSWVADFNLTIVNYQECVNTLSRDWQRVQRKNATFTFQKGAAENITLNGNVITVVHPLFIATLNWSPPQEFNSGIYVADALPNFIKQETVIYVQLIEPLCKKAMEMWDEIPPNVPVEMVHDGGRNLIRVGPLEVTYTTVQNPQ
jgi:hypothetical protein